MIAVMTLIIFKNGNEHAFKEPEFYTIEFSMIE